MTEKMPKAWSEMSPDERRAWNAAQERQVGCEGDDGLLRIHDESETCDVCAPKATKEVSVEDFFQSALPGHYVLPRGDYDHIVTVLRRIVTDLPAQRDWLDPDVERAARDILAKAKS